MSIVAGTWLAKVRMSEKVKKLYPCSTYPNFTFNFLAYVLGKKIFDEIIKGKDVRPISDEEFATFSVYDEDKKQLIKNSLLYKNWESLGLKACPDVYFSQDEVDSFYENPDLYNSRLATVDGELHTVNYIANQLEKINSDFSFEIENSKMIFRGRSAKNISTDKWNPKFQSFYDDHVLEVVPLDFNFFVRGLNNFAK